MMAAMSTKSTEKKEARNGLSRAAVLPSARSGFVAQPDLDLVSDLAAQALAEDAQRLGREDDDRLEHGIDPDLGHRLFGRVAVDLGTARAGRGNRRC